MDKDPVRKIAEWYDRLSSSYDELYGEEQDLKHKIILDHIGPRKITTLLDVGCGTGRFLEMADPLYSYGLGVDISKRMLLLAKRRRSLKTDLVQAASSRLPIKNKTMDCTVSISTSKADTTVPEFIGEVQRISTENSMTAMILFDQSTDGEGVPKAGAQFSRKINDRETLYVIEFGTTGSK